MKRFFVAILSLLYICTSTGATVHIHYCMGKLADWGFGNSQSKTCSGCGMEKTTTGDNGCCKDEHRFLKNNTDQKIAESGFQLVQLISVAVPGNFFKMPVVDLLSISEEIPVSHAPPRSSNIPVYIRCCVYRI